MATLEIVIPDFLPTSVNTLLRLHWAERNRRLKLETELIALSCVLAKVPHAECRRRVALTFTAPGGRGAKTGDVDARLKVILDALVKAGALVDDSPRWCQLAPPVLLKGPKRTVIVLEDLP